MMGAIFSGAKLVLACLGPHADSEDSRVLLEFVKSHEQFLSYISDQVHQGRFAMMVDLSRIGRLETMKRQFSIYSWLMLRPMSELERHSYAITKLLARPYFLRVWIAQEMFLARQVIICCGHDQCPGKAMAGLRTPFMLEEIPGSSRALNFIPGVRRWISDDDTDNFEMPERLRHTGIEAAPSFLLACAGNRNNLTQDFSQVVNEVTTLECTEPRDTVVGVLGFLRKEYADMINVDYSVSTFQLALNVLRAFGEHSLQDFSLSSLATN